MIAVLNKDASDDQIHELVNWIESQGLRTNLSKGEFHTLLGLIGDTKKIDPEMLESLEIVEFVKRITDPPEKELPPTTLDPRTFGKAGIKTVGIAGLGLIGGSFAKAYKENSSARVLGWNRSASTSEFARMEGTLDDILTRDNIGECDLLIPCFYPDRIISWVREMAPYIKKGALVIDAGGLKRKICRELFATAKEYGFTFVGGHPMAGKRYSGYKYSTGQLYSHASMIIVPENPEDTALLERVRQALSPCLFGNLTVCSPERHDQMIAFTSEMPHILSNAFIKSPTAERHDGFSAGSYKDLTRVAWLNETMWTEIFMENRDFIIDELSHLISSLGEYKEALEKEDADRLKQLLYDGKMAKERIDGK